MKKWLLQNEIQWHIFQKLQCLISVISKEVNWKECNKVKYIKIKK